MTFDQLPDILHPKELATYLRIGRDATYALLKNGAIRSARIGQKYCIPKESLRVFLELRTRPEPSLAKEH